MNTMKWLVRREFWENKGMFFWAPIVVSVLLILALGGGMIYGVSQGHVRIDGEHTSLVQAIGSVSAEQRAEFASAVATTYMSVSAPLIIMFAIVAFFYCLGALYEERRDRSILFWKSLPVSDTQTVLSKLATTLLVAPAIFVASATVMAAALMLILCTSLLMLGHNIFGMVLGNSAVYTSPLLVISLLPVYILWALPTAGWLMMVSSWARSKVFLWAVGVPLAVMVATKWATSLYSLTWNIDWFNKYVVLRSLGGLLPGNWILFENIGAEAFKNPNGSLNLAGLVSHSYMTLSSPSVWIGAAAGVAMIVVAIRMRRWKDEG
jgi:ABC-2 type transport system permease protein